MKYRQLALLLGFVMFACTHESAVSGATDTQTPKAEPEPAPADNAAPPASCTSDADCQAVDVYCGGCQCLALPVSTAVPKCQGNQVNCFAQPCRGQRAVCKASACSLTGGAITEE
jgi:hypothetical protein